jgi:colicin import membrane protein
MSTATLVRDAGRPRAPDALGPGAALALLVHMLLLVAIALGVSWRTREADGVVAELWSAVPQVAAPQAAAPPPAPAPTPKVEPKPAPSPTPAAEARPDAQIAIERARREAEAREAERRDLEAQRRAAREQAERDAAREKAEAQKREQLAAREAAAKREKEAAEKARRDEVALAAQREAFLKRMQGQAAGEPEGGGTAARTSGPSASYAGRIRARIKPNIVFADDLPGNPTAIVEVRCAPDGTIVSRKLVKSSGAGPWDDAVLRAIDKTEVLPRDTDGRVPSPMQLEFRPRD